MRVLLIVNATASSVTARRRVVIEAALRADHDLTVAHTTRRGHASRLARAAAYDGTELVVVLAGDGTLNEAADGLRGSTVALAPLPGGSTNVYARTLGVPDDPVDATAQLLESIADRSLRRIPVGSANGRTFLFHCGVGFDAAVIRRVEARSALKRYVAHPLFVWQAVRAWADASTRHRRFDVDFPDGSHAHGALLVVSKTSPWTYLGTRPVVTAPDAGLDTPLAATLLRDATFFTLVGAGLRAMRSGQRFVRSRSVTYAPGIDRLRVRSEQGFPWQVDGDYLGEVNELDIALVPDALTIVVPSNPQPIGQPRERR